METKKKEIQDHYEAKLRAEAYHRQMIAAIEIFPEMFEFILTSIRDVIRSGRFSGTKLLEIGSGATVHNIASASAQFTSIVQSDFVLDNCDQLRRWHKGESTLDWSPFLDLVSRLEGCSDLASSRQDLESRIRKSVQCVVRSDVLSDEVIPLHELKSPATRPPYDLIISVLCLPAAVVDYDDYVAVLRRLNGLLRPGGGLLLCDFENGRPWDIEVETFHYAELSLEEITKAFELAGFRNIDTSNRQKLEEKFDYKTDFIYCVFAEKI